MQLSSNTKSTAGNLINLPGLTIPRWEQLYDIHKKMFHLQKVSLYNVQFKTGPIAHAH